MSPLYYWRSGDGLEVHLLVDYDGKLYSLEEKATSTVTPLRAKGLQRWHEL